MGFLLLLSSFMTIMAKEYGLHDFHLLESIEIFFVAYNYNGQFLNLFHCYLKIIWVFHFLETKRAYIIEELQIIP